MPFRLIVYVHLAPSHKVKALDIPDSTLNGDVNYTKTIQSGGFQIMDKFRKG